MSRSPSPSPSSIICPTPGPATRPCFWWGFRATDCIGFCAPLLLGIEDHHDNWWDISFITDPPSQFWPDSSPVALTLTFVPTNPPTTSNYGTATLSWQGSGDDAESPLTWTLDSPMGSSLAIVCKSVNPFAWWYRNPFPQWEVKFQNIYLNGRQIICDFDVDNGIFSATVTGLNSLPNGFVLTGDIIFHFFQSQLWQLLNIFGRAYCEVRIERLNTDPPHWPYGNGTPP